MSRHSSPRPQFIPNPRTSLQPEPSTHPMWTVDDRSPREVRPNHRGTLQSGVALAAVVVGAASVGLPATGALTEGVGEIADGSQTNTALAATQNQLPPPGPAVATSQVLSVPALDGPQTSSTARDVQALRKADDRRASEQKGEDKQRQDSATAQSAPTGGDFSRPVAGRVTSNFGARSGGTHYGLDVANRIGTPIRAAASGTVISAGPASGFGLWVRVRHDDGTITVYGHINKALVDVGQEVSAGELIAEVGNRGQSSGPHLHFEAHSAGGKKLDPGRWLDQRGVGF